MKNLNKIAKAFNVLALIIGIITLILSLYILQSDLSLNYLYSFLALNTGTLLVFGFVALAAWLRLKVQNSPVDESVPEPSAATSFSLAPENSTLSV